MFLQPDFLIEGEKIVGRYQAEIARWSNERFISTVPALYAYVTNYRFVLQPQTRKRYTPASIPGRWIDQVHPLNAPRRGISLEFKDGYKIYLFIIGDQSEALMKQLKSLAALPTVDSYAAPLSLDSLRRLINHLEVF